MSELTLNEKYRKYTGVLMDVEAAIASAAGLSDEEKEALYARIEFNIPEGLIRTYEDSPYVALAKQIKSELGLTDSNTPSTVEVEETPEEELNETPEEELNETPAEQPIVEEEQKDEDLQGLLGE